MSRIAVIDTGTNSTRLLIAETGTDGIHEVMRQTEITRLGQGVDDKGRLSDEAKERVHQCLIRYAAIIGELGAERAMIIATSSIRDAADGRAFLRSQAESLGFDGVLLTGELEAELSFAGGTMDMEKDAKTMLFDIGGGSTEIVLGRGESIEYSISLNLGCVRLKERYLKTDPLADSEMAAAADFIEAELQNTNVIDHLEGLQQAIAVAGTVTTLAAIDMGLETYDRDLIHNYKLSRTRIDRLTAELAAMSLEQRMMIPVMEKGRADVIAAGSLIVSGLLKFTGTDEFAVSEHDILDGTALAMKRGRL